MALKLSPELWVANYIKSATNGRQITVRLRRILTIIILPIWILGFLYTVLYCYDATLAIPQYQKAKDEVKMNESDVRYKEWPYSERLASDRDKMNMWEDKIYGFTSILFYLMICFLFPWIITRLTFWIIDADKAEEL